MRTTITIIDEDGIRPLKEIIREATEIAIEYCMGSKAKAARALGVSRITIYRRLRRGRS